MKVAGLQSDIVWEDPRANFERYRPRIAAAVAAGAQLVVLPEMFATGFSMAAERITEPPGGECEAFLVEQASEHGVVLIGSVATSSEGGGMPRNLGIVARPGGAIETYAKIHPFTFAQEDRHYAAGHQALVTEVGGMRVALTICYDLRFGEMYMALAPRVDLFVIIANWPEPRRHHWKTLLEARSIECMSYVLGVNRVGEGGGLVYTGDSCLWAPMGECLSAAAPGAEEMVLGEVSAEVVKQSRERFPVLSDRRVEIYRDM